MRGTWVQSLVWEDPTYHRATKPVPRHYRVQAPGVCAPREKPPSTMRSLHTATKSRPRLPQQERALKQQ